MIVKLNYYFQMQKNNAHVPLALPLTYNNAIVQESPNKQHFIELAQEKSATISVHTTIYDEKTEYEKGQYVCPISVFDLLVSHLLDIAVLPKRIAVLNLDDTLDITWHHVAVIGTSSYRKRVKLAGKLDEDGNVVEEEFKAKHYFRPHYHVLHASQSQSALRRSDMRLLKENDLSFIKFYLYKAKPTSIGTPVDDIVASYLHDNTLKSYPPIPKFCEANKEVAKFFTINSWKKFTLHSDINTICKDSVEFITKYIKNNPRNVLYQQAANEQGISGKQNTDFTRSRISLITTFISWTYYQQNEFKSQPAFYVMHCFTPENMQAYLDFQLDSLGKKLIVQASYFRNMFEAFQFVCKSLVTWIPSLELRNAQKDFFVNTNNRSIQWLKTMVSQVQFKDKIWTNMSKQADFLDKANLTITLDDIRLVESTCISIVQSLHNLWYDMEEQRDLREQLWNKRGYHVMESHVWMVLLHMWMFGIRPGSLLQINKENLLCQYTGPKTFALSFQFKGYDKSQHGGVDRRLGFSKLTTEFLFYLYDRLPLAHVRYNRESYDPCIFLSTTGQVMTKDQLTVIFRKVYGAILKKYACPRLVRFWLGHYGYQAAKDNDGQLLSLCYLFNHSISTHLKYYVCSDKVVEHNPMDDTNLFNTYFSQ